MLSEKIQEQYHAFVKAVQENPVLDSKTTTLIFLAVAMAEGCQP